MWSDDLPADIRAYHRRTKHASGRYALGPAFLDWESQPDPFRRFEGARLISLPLAPDAPTPPFAAVDEGIAARPLEPASLGLFLELSLGLSAWKDTGESRWALRNNPSSGNLHPTEGWVILPGGEGWGEGPGLYHYAPRDHGLEERCRLESVPCALPAGGFLFALSSIGWRESWKYGERAFRYCQHDVGHALAAAAYAAACLGWHLRVLKAPGDATLSALLGLGRDDAWARYEQEYPELIALVSPEPEAEPELAVPGGIWAGRANALSADPDRWPAVELAFRYTHRPEGVAKGGWQGWPAPAVAATDEPAAAIIRRRRSAQRMDNVTGMGRDAFFRALSRTLPDGDAVPWRAFPWPPRHNLFLFVHRVEGLAPGLYCLVRDPSAQDRLRRAADPAFAWEQVADCPLPLFLLAEGDWTRKASGLSCLQAIAGHSAFSLGMVADFDRCLAEEGDWAYRRLFWEAGMIGQVLYLEATAAGLSGTGIGCYFDDEVHAALGLAPEWQSLYHFTIGGALEDKRLATLPAYDHLHQTAGRQPG